MLRNILTQLLVFFLIFHSLSFLRETTMLSTSTSIKDTVIELPTLMGDKIKVHSEGKKTVIYFFAPWCQVCHASISNLQSLFENNEDIDVIAVAMDYLSVSEVSQFNQKHQLSFPIALGNEQVKKHFKITGYPSYYILDEYNTITGRSLGYTSEIGLYLRSL
ncbi:MAG: redoxin domain-containing protein [Alteromonadaceae bacterium]